MKPCFFAITELAAQAEKKSMAESGFSRTSPSPQLIGAEGYGELKRRNGAVYMYRYTGSSWSQEAKILPDYNGENHPTAGLSFGSEVMLSGDVLAVWARGHGTPVEYGESPGGVFVFRHDLCINKIVATRTTHCLICAPHSQAAAWRTRVQYGNLPPSLEALSLPRVRS